MQADDASTARAVADYNHEPGVGYVYAIVNLSATFNGDGSGDAGIDLSVLINGIDDLDSDGYCTILDNSFGLKTLYTGQTDSGQECRYIKRSKTTSGFVSVVADQYGSPKTAYWRID